MEPIILTFRIRGRQARAKLPASLPQELSDALENCLHWIPAPLSHMPGLCLCDESCIQRWTERVPDRPLARRLCRMLLLSGFLGERQPGVLAVPTHLLQTAGIERQSEMSLLEPGCILVQARQPPRRRKEAGGARP